MKSIFNTIQYDQKALQLPWRFILINIILFIIFSALAFHQNAMYLFYSNDGQHTLALARWSAIWHGSEFGFSNNFLQSNGGIGFPLNTALFPGFILAALFKNNIIYSEVAAYLVFALEFFSIALIISRSIGLSWNLALISAWVLPLIAYPYHYYAYLYNIMETVPELGTVIVASDLIIILFAFLGRSTIRRFLFGSAGIILLLVYIVIANPPSIVMSAPIIALVCLGYLISCASIREKKFKIFFTAATLVISIPLIIFVYSVLKFTVSYYLTANLNYGEHTIINWYYISLLFHGKDNPDTWLFTMASLGVVLCSFSGNNFQKSFARAVLFAMIVLIGFGIVLTSTNFWTGPMPFYFEFMLWPFYVCYSVAFVGAVFAAISKLLFSKLQFYVNILVRALIILMPWSLFLLAAPIGDCWDVPKPPTKTAITEILNNNIALAPGKPFLGRVANFTGLKIKKPVTWGADIAANDNEILRQTGNDHRMSGNWFYNIPTLEVYTPVISPIYFQFAKFFFALPEDEQIRSVITMRNPNIRWLTALGVRYVVTDALLPHANLVKVMPLKNMGDLYLYELSIPNIGQYSPTKIIQLTNSKDILDKLNESNFDPQTQVVTEITLPMALNKAINGKIIVDKGSINVSASSQGYSLLLLPLEYSHCLTLRSHLAKEQAPRLFRANLTQTGVLFYRKLDASIRYFTGPLSHPTCRLADSKDFERLSSLRD